ncbi:hypothetical protein Tco_0693515 [Tanacetum coccineum]
MIAYLEKTGGNAEFHEIMDFLTRSSIYYALTISPVVSTTFVEQLWMFSKSKTINNVRYITATVAGKPVTISDASIRSDVLFDDADGIDTLNNQAIFDTIKLMGYEGDLNVLTFNKALFSPQWKFPFHTMNHCISSKSTSWDQIPTNIATTGMSERPSESQPISSPTHPSEDQPKPQPDPSPRPSPSIPIPDSNPEGSGGNHEGQSSSDRSLSGNEDGLTLQSVYDLCVSLGRKTAKSKPTAHKDQAFDDLDDFDAMDYMETEDAHNEKGVSTKDQVSTVKPDEGTDKPKVSTDKIDEGTKRLYDSFVESTAAEIKDQVSGAKVILHHGSTCLQTPTPTSLVMIEDLFCSSSLSQ